jgi:paraquat-inducible protein B
VNVRAFVRAPYDKLVHPESRFWNAGGVDVAVGAQGVRIRANSWQQLLSGGIAFETPDDALSRAPSEPGATFRLYDNIQVANRVARDDELVYLADFDGNLRGVDAGTPVELEGVEVGQVKEVELKYDESRHTLVTLVTLTVDPDKVQILNLSRPSRDANQRATVDSWIEKLVHDGLRAQVSTANLLTGYKIIALDIVKTAKRGAVQRAGKYIGIPTAPTGDIGETLEALRKVLNNIDRVTGGPELENVLKSLDATLTGLNQMTREVTPDLRELIASLKQTSDSIQTLAGGGAAAAAGQPGPDIARLTRELTEAARSVRTLADYLERHPEALLRGRKGAEK